VNLTALEADMAISARGEGIIVDVENAVALDHAHPVRRFDRLRTRRLLAGAGLLLWGAAVWLCCAAGPVSLVWIAIAASWVILALIAARMLVHHARP
jgi:hypothetical protein